MHGHSHRGSLSDTIDGIPIYNLGVTWYWINHFTSKNKFGVVVLRQAEIKWEILAVDSYCYDPDSDIFNKTKVD